MHRLLLALMIVPLLAATGARANLLTNGDFATGNLTSWTASGAVDVLLEADYGPCCGAHNTTPGAYMLTFGGGNQPSGGTVAQSFATVIGTSYLVSFGYGAIGASQSQSLSAAVASGGTTTLAAAASSATSDFSVLFGSYSFTFVAGATLSTLSFTDTSLVTDSVDALLRNASVTAVASLPPLVVVPEPATLLGGGLLGFGAVRRRARRG